MRYFVRMGALDGYTDLLEQMGVDPFSWLARVSLMPAQVSEPDLMIPYASVGKLMEMTAHELNQPCLGARVSRFQGLSSVGLVGAYMAQQATIEQALVCARKFTETHAQGVSIVLTKSGGQTCEIAVEIEVNDRQQYPQLVQMSIGLLEAMLREMAGNQWRAQKICLRQRLEQKNHTAIEHIFGCPVETGSPCDSLVFDSAALHYPPCQPANLLERIVEKQFAQQQMNQMDPRQLIRHAINVLLPTGDCSKENIAASLGMHPKKLERQLRQHDTSYRELLDKTRQEIALRTLDMNNVSMLSLALNLGYADFSAFSRSFKRWTGLAPSLYLKSHNKP